jgi:hypothetical protein
MLAQSRSDKLAETLELQATTLLRALATTMETLAELHPGQPRQWLDNVEQRLTLDMEQGQAAADSRLAIRVIIQSVRDSNCYGARAR